MKVAIVHYWFIERRGGEKVVESILKLFPEADIYTLFYDKNNFGPYLGSSNVYTSVLNKPLLRKHYQKIFPLYPLGIKSLKLKKDYDLVISSESGPAKGIRIRNNAKHICYIHSPMRYCYTHTDVYLTSVNPVLRPFMKYFLRRLRHYDQQTIANVDLYIANSKNVAERVKKFYNRESYVVHPPIADELFTQPIIKNRSREVYLSFGALTPYKRIDLLIDTFNELDKQLIIIGRGSEKRKLSRKAASNIVFLDFKNWQQIENILVKTKALLFPGEEDFGMIPLEIMAYGIPVIAFKKGGVLETVIENRKNPSKSTGLFFERQQVASLLSAINLFERMEGDFDPQWIRQHASKFSEKYFLRNFMELTNRLLITK